MRTRIFIIDSGGPPGKEGNLVFCGGKLSPDFIGDGFGHGTAVLGIIRDGAPSADITCIRLVDNDSGTSAGELAELLEYILCNCDVDIINMSLGITGGDLRSLHTVCSRLDQKGVVLISAFDNNGAISYPAAFSEVIGIASDTYCRRKDLFIYCDDSMVNLLAHGNIQRVSWKDSKKILISGNSFAAAHATVKAAQYVAVGARGRTEILECFRRDSLYNLPARQSPCKKTVPFEIRRAVLFPFNKEMHSLMRFNDMLPFEVAGIYEGRYSALTGSSASRIIESELHHDIVIRKVSECDFESFDTAVIGHCRELSRYGNRELIKQFVEELVSHRKNIYSFDDLSYIVPDFSYEKWFYPRVDEADVPPDRFGKLFRISTPVLGVFGTSSKQGKYTLQLALRKKLMSVGYRVGQIGTEPSALLFGMDCCYPMGYASEVKVSGANAVRFLNNAVKELEEDSDIIIVGSQSGTVPYSCDNTSFLCFAQYEFLLGTQPDAVILCINPYDELEYIERTVKTIEGSGAKVIAAAVFPMTFVSEQNIFGKRRITGEEENRIVQDVFRCFGIPALVFNNGKETDRLADAVIDFFGA